MARKITKSIGPVTVMYGSKEEMQNAEAKKLGMTLDEYKRYEYQKSKEREAAMDPGDRALLERARAKSRASKRAENAGAIRKAYRDRASTSTAAEKRGTLASAVSKAGKSLASAALKGFDSV